MYPNKFDFLLKLIANKGVRKEPHADPNEEMRQNLVDYAVMSLKPVDGRYLGMYVALQLAFHRVHLGVNVVPGRGLQQNQESFGDCALVGEEEVGNQ